MAVLIFSLVPTAERPAPAGGAALSISDEAARRLREVVPGPTGTLLAKDLPLLARLAERESDSDLRLVSAAIRSHGSVTVRWVG